MSWQTPYELFDGDVPEQYYFNDYIRDNLTVLKQGDVSGLTRGNHMVVPATGAETSSPVWRVKDTLGYGVYLPFRFVAEDIDGTPVDGHKLRVTLGNKTGDGTSYNQTGATIEVEMTDTAEATMRIYTHDDDGIINATPGIEIAGESSGRVGFGTQTHTHTLNVGTLTATNIYDSGAAVATTWDVATTGVSYTGDVRVTGQLQCDELDITSTTVVSNLNAESLLGENWGTTEDLGAIESTTASSASPYTRVAVKTVPRSGHYLVMGFLGFYPVHNSEASGGARAELYVASSSTSDTLSTVYGYNYGGLYATYASSTRVMSVPVCAVLACDEGESIILAARDYVGPAFGRLVAVWKAPYRKGITIKGFADPAVFGTPTITVV